MGLVEENALLKKEIKDLKMTLKINKEMLSELKADSSLEQLLEKDKKIMSLKKEKQKLKIIIGTQENIISDLRKQKEADKNTIFLYQNKLTEKESIIATLKEDFQSANKKNSKKQKGIIISSPNSFNTQLNSEIVEAKELIKKYSHLLIEEKKASEQKDKKIKFLEEVIEGKKKSYKIIKNLENIEKYGYLLSDDNFEVENEGQTTEELKTPSSTFPTKIVQERRLNETQCVPKLDFKRVYEDMEERNQKTLINVVEYEKNANDMFEDDYVEKLKFMVKYYRKLSEEKHKKIKNLKRLCENLKLSLDSKNYKSLTKTLNFEPKLFEEDHSMFYESTKITKNITNSDLLENIDFDSKFFEEEITIVVSS